MALYTTISSALGRICPTANDDRTSCTAYSIETPKIVNAKNENLSEEVLSVQVEASSCITTQLRDAMIRAAAIIANLSSVLHGGCAKYRCVDDDDQGLREGE